MSTIERNVEEHFLYNKIYLVVTTSEPNQTSYNGIQLKIKDSRELAGLATPVHKLQKVGTMGVLRQLGHR